ncbi:MAG TPA: branched-chain amino acid ABC transporter permease [Alphaproteobacteria bacterium]|nr:branched-chain amino acid ABC transporter permease [Alphaproteobacteria bacterium]
MKFSPQAAAILLGLALLALVPVFSALAGESFYVDLFTRILIFAIAAMSLDLILGYGGMVSFGHAAYLGIGSYAVGILDHYGVDNGFLQFALAIGASAAVALFIGAVSLRTSGVYFIMITLAFTQMIYFLGVSLNTFGGDDGMNIAHNSDFAGLIDLGNATALYYFVLGFLILFLVLGYRLVDSRFGMAIRGAKSNERRMIAIGFPTYRYKLAAFVIAGAVCGVAGALLANQSLFMSPAIMHWSRSGEIMVMVLLGGTGTLFGPVVGAVVLLALENTLSGYTEHWQAILGPILVLVVLFARQGLFGLVERRAAHGAGRG